MTIGFWILTIVIGVCGFGLAFFLMWYNDSFRDGAFALFATILAVALNIFGGHWYFGNTASGARALKDEQSNLNKGLNREITITAEDGREIFHYIGKCDIETTNEYILFEDENGLRQMIYWGIQDTIIISELPE